MSATIDAITPLPLAADSAQAEMPIADTSRSEAPWICRRDYDDAVADTRDVTMSTYVGAIAMVVIMIKRRWRCRHYHDEWRVNPGECTEWQSAYDTLMPVRLTPAANHTIADVTPPPRRRPPDAIRR